jgi:RNA polymerase sigma-70 factor (ECF subfamily)
MIMVEDETFAHLLAQVRSGDGQAVAELVPKYGRLVRFGARLRLTDPRQRRLGDSLDICQSALARSFIRIAGQADLDCPAPLVRLRVTLVRNQGASAARQQRRPADRQRDDGVNVDERVGAAEPGSPVAHRALLQAVPQRLTAEERPPVTLRGRGEPGLRSPPNGAVPPKDAASTWRALDLITRRVHLDETGHD